MDVDQQTGLVSAVWYDARNDDDNERVEIFIGVSTDGGDTFQPNILVSDAASDQSGSTGNNYLEYIGIAALSCTGYPVWSDNSNDPADLDYFTDQVSLDTPPTIDSVTATPNVLWPPNHKMVPVAVNVLATDICDQAAPTCEIITVSSNEPPSGKGSGRTAPDWEITGPLTVDLRAERSGKGSGREYTIATECTDTNGNTSTETVIVTVPHDQRG